MKTNIKNNTLETEFEYLIVSECMTGEITCDACEKTLTPGQKFVTITQHRDTGNPEIGPVAPIITHECEQCYEEFKTL
jgi:hypothetical protein